MKYELIYSNRKTLSLSVKDARVIVRAPYATSREKIERAISENSEWLERHIKRQRERVDLSASLSPEEISALKKEARRVLGEKTEYYAGILGLKYGRITITSAKGRFGSCSSAGNIAYSYRLMLYPERAQDYVVVHELCHLLEMNHSRQFYALVCSVLPDYKERRKLLK